jgi:hypothetical protein
MHNNRILRSFFCFTFILQTLYLNAQNQKAAKLVEKFDTFNKSYYNEKIYMHLDRTEYIAGEQIYFKIYCIDYSFNQLSDISKVAYVELLDSDNEIFSQEKIRLNHGTGFGHIFIAEDLISGSYYVRAYTNLMKNFNPGGYFYHKIIVINPFIRPEQHTNRTTGTKQDHFSVKFYPEGDNFIAGIKNRITFEMTGNVTNNRNITGKILDSKDSVITSVATFENGYGRFEIIPEARKRYKAVFLTEDSVKFTKNLPRANISGYTMHIERIQNEFIKINLHHHAQLSEQKQNNLILMFLSRGNMLRLKPVSLTKNGYSLSVPYDIFPEGMNHFILLDDTKNTLCQRAVYVKEKNNHVKINLKNLKKQYTPRQPVELVIETKDSDGNPVNTQLSMSISLKNGINDLQSSISEYFYIGPEILHSQTFSENLLYDNQNDKFQDVVASTLTSSFFYQMEYLTKKNQIHYEFLPEKRGILIGGVVLEKSTLTPKPDELVIFSIKGKRSAIQGCKTDNNGRFFFSLPDRYGIQNFVYTLSDTSNNYIIKPDDQFSTQFMPLPNKPLKIKKGWKESIELMMVNYQASKAFEHRKKMTEAANRISALPFYGDPDESVVFSEYVKLPVMEEFFRELISKVILTKHKGNYKIRILDRYLNRIIGENPLLMIDGVPVFDANKILKLNPPQVDKINIVCQKYYVGELEMDGILDVITKKTNFEGTDISKYSLIQSTKALQITELPFFPQYETPKDISSPFADFRNLLFWQPVIKTNDKGQARIKFYTPDNPGKFNISIQGIGENGAPVDFSGRFTVRH